MSSGQLTGLVQTVLGPVHPDALGPTMTHEHLLIDFTCMFRPPAEASGLHYAYQPVELENLGWIRYHWFSNRDNLLLLDEETAIAEAAEIQAFGRRDNRRGDDHRNRTRPPWPGARRTRHRTEHRHGGGLLRRRRPPRRDG